MLTKVTKPMVTPDVPMGAFKNKIINGNFDIWQRGVSFVPIAHNDYSVDRIKYKKGGVGVHSLDQTVDIPDIHSNYSLRIIPTTIDATIGASDRYILQHYIEGFNYKAIKDKVATLSFYVKAFKPGIYCIGFNNGLSDRSYVVEYTINSSNVWEKKEITLTFDQTGGVEGYTDGIGLIINFVLACGSNWQTTPDAWQNGNFFATANQVNGVDSTSNAFRLSQIQLEVGRVATDFEHRSISQELALCQRYYEYLTGVVIGAYMLTGEGATMPLSMVTEKRIIPATTIIGSWNLNNCTGLSIASYTSSRTQLYIQVVITATGTYQVNTDVDTGVGIDAEL